MEEISKPDKIGYDQYDPKLLTPNELNQMKETLDLKLSLNKGIQQLKCDSKEARKNCALREIDEHFFDALKIIDNDSITFDHKKHGNFKLGRTKNFKRKRYTRNKKFHSLQENASVMNASSIRKSMNKIQK